MSLTYLSLFSGIGGMDLGLDRAGMRCVGQVEIDPFCRAVLAKHWPDVPRHDDVRTFTKDLLREQPDLIAGGFPCQDISRANDGASGLSGPRSGLWSEMFRIIRDVRPRFVLVENVSALLEWQFGRVLGDLADIRYDAEWDCLPIGAFGATHFRNRLFLVAYPRKERVERQGHRLDAVVFAGRFVPPHAPHRKRWPETWLVEQFRSGPIEPLIRGGGNGIPAWVDRVGGPGNAVSPQIAEYIGRIIIAAHASRERGAA